MPNTVVVGAQWGDEGKAKVIDMLAVDADVVVRYQGGCNAGHTVQHGGEVFKFHHLPSGLLYPGKLCVIGSGTVIHPEILFKEIETLHQRGYATEGLKISNRAHLTLAHHIVLDQQQESSLAEKKIGTTGRGIGPTYSDKVSRLGLRICDLYQPEPVLKERLAQILKAKARELSHLNTKPQTVETLYATCQELAQRFQPYVADTVYLLNDCAAQGKTLLFEGAQGTLLDLDFGTYPFVTSSNATAGGACTGSGVGPTQVHRVIGVMKAYTTRVGSGPFPTELTDETGKRLVEAGAEFGTTTGRMRRCGWFDAVMGRYSVLVNGLDGLAITKLDVLDGFETLQLCVAYRNTQTGETVDRFPAHPETLSLMEPVYESFPGWSGSVRGVRQYADLPPEAKTYLTAISERVGAPIAIVSVGPDREETIVLDNPVRGGKSISSTTAVPA